MNIPNHKFLAQICFQIEVEGKKTVSFDNQWRLILADSKSEAIFLARELGLNEEQIFLNENEKKVHWKFMGVPEIIEIPELAHGVEIISQLVSPEDAKDYSNYIKLKSQDLALDITKKELTYHL